MTFFESSSRSSLLLEHDLFRKPVSTFRDHALAEQRTGAHIRWPPIHVSFKDLDVVLGGERFDLRLIAIVYTVNLDEIVGKPSGDDRQKQTPVL
jgi:hypothetical protein